MKKQVVFLSLLMLTLLLAGAALAQDPTAEPTAEPEVNPICMEETFELADLGGRTVSIAVENAYPPFNSIDEETGEAVGWDYDATAAICERLNCVPEYVQTSWDGMLVAVGQGEFDVAADGITITEEREEVVDFSIGYIQVDQALLIRVGEDRFVTVEDFVADESLIIGVQLGTTNYDTAIELVGEDRVQPFDLFPVAVQALIAGDVDAVVMDDTAGLGYVGANPDDVQLLDTPIKSDFLGFAFPPDSDLVEPFNAALCEIMMDGTLDEINAVWFDASDAEAEATAEATAAP